MIISNFMLFVWREWKHKERSVPNKIEREKWKQAEQLKLADLGGEGIRGGVNLGEQPTFFTPTEIRFLNSQLKKKKKDI